MSYQHYYLIDLSYHKLESKKHLLALRSAVLIRNALQTQQDHTFTPHTAHAAHLLNLLTRYPSDNSPEKDILHHELKENDSATSTPYDEDQHNEDEGDEDEDFVMEDEWGDMMLRSAILRAGIPLRLPASKPCKQTSTLISDQPRQLSQSLAN